MYGIVSRLPLDRERDEGRPSRLADASVFEIQRLREVLEEALSATEDDRRDDDVELVDDAGIESLPDDVGSAADADVLIAGGGSRPVDRFFEVSDEGEFAGVGLLLGPMRDHEHGDAERIP